MFQLIPEKQLKMGVLTLYHYTTEKNLEAIQMSRVINISEGGRDAHFGKGI